MSKKDDIIAGISARIKKANPDIKRAFLAGLSSKSIKELERIFDSVHITSGGDIEVSETPKKRGSKTKDTGQDFLGFNKKDYPFIGVVAIIALNAWGFNVGGAVPLLATILVDCGVVFYLYKRFMPKREPKAPVAKMAPVTKEPESGEQETDTEAQPEVTPTPRMIRSQRSLEKRAADSEERGVFGLRKRHYPLLVGVILVVFNITAFRSGSTPFFAVALLLDLVVGYFAYTKYGLPSWMRKGGK